MDKERTGQLITELRKEKGLTQKQLADALNVTDKQRMKRIMWENGIPTAKYVQVSSVEDFIALDLNYPLMVKRGGIPYACSI